MNLGAWKSQAKQRWTGPNSVHTDIPAPPRQIRPRGPHHRSTLLCAENLIHLASKSGGFRLLADENSELLLEVGHHAGADDLRTSQGYERDRLDTASEALHQADLWR